MHERRAIRIRGLVQGVHFRVNAAHQAKSRNITGFVRNEPDGSVYIEAEGEYKALEAFVHWCSEGPALAKVTEVTQELLPPQQESDFTTR